MHISFDNVALKHQAEFATCDTNTGRVESLLHSHMAAPNSSYLTLWGVVKQVLLLSHGDMAKHLLNGDFPLTDRSKLRTYLERL